MKREKKGKSMVTVQFSNSDIPKWNKSNAQMHPSEWKKENVDTYISKACQKSLERGKNRGCCRNN